MSSTGYLANLRLGCIGGRTVPVFLASNALFRSSSTLAGGSSWWRQVPKTHYGSKSSVHLLLSGSWLPTLCYWLQDPCFDFFNVWIWIFFGHLSLSGPLHKTDLTAARDQFLFFTKPSGMVLRADWTITALGHIQCSVTFFYIHHSPRHHYLSLHSSKDAIPSCRFSTPHSFISHSSPIPPLCPALAGWTHHCHSAVTSLWVWEPSVVKLCQQTGLLPSRSSLLPRKLFLWFQAIHYKNKSGRQGMCIIHRNDLQRFPSQVSFCSLPISFPLP